MALLPAQHSTLVDVASRLTPDKSSIAAIAELLSQTNPVLEDMPWEEGNLATGNKTTIRSGLPTSTWRKLYGYVQPSKSTTTAIEDDCGMLEAYSSIDPDLARLAPNPAAYIMSESKAHIESMTQALTQALFYANNVNTPEQFLGLSPRFSSLSAENGENIVDAGGTGSDNASIWLIGWGSDTCFGIYPKGSKAGLSHVDMGEELETDSNGGKRRMLVNHFKWDAGLVLKDWRYVVRIANIDRSDLKRDASSGANLPQLMDEAINLMHSLSGVRPVFYMDRKIKTILGAQIENRISNSTLQVADVGGIMTEMFHGIPVKRVDRLAANEARVT